MYAVRFTHQRSVRTDQSGLLCPTCRFNLIRVFHKHKNWQYCFPMRTQKFPATKKLPPVRLDQGIWVVNPMLSLLSYCDMWYLGGSLNLLIDGPID